MKFWDIQLYDYEVNCRLNREELSEQQQSQLQPQEHYFIKGTYIVLGLQHKCYNVFINELVAVDDAGNELRLVESEGIDYEALEEYIEGIGDTYKWYNDWLDEQSHYLGEYNE